MMTTEQARELADGFIAALQRKDFDALLSLCGEDVEWSGILVRKVTGESSGTIRGKAAVRRFAEELFESGGGYGVTFNRLGVGVRSVVIDVSFDGIIPGFSVLVVDSEGKIAQVLMHQEML